MIAGDTLLAKQLLQKEAFQNPSNKDTWHNLGLLQIQSHDYSDARECFDRVHAIDPKDGFAVLPPD
jgi:lipoprotein NlpI